MWNQINNAGLNNKDFFLLAQFWPVVQISTCPSNIFTLPMDKLYILQPLLTITCHEKFKLTYILSDLDFSLPFQHFHPMKFSHTEILTWASLLFSPIMSFIPNMTQHKSMYYVCRDKCM